MDDYSQTQLTNSFVLIKYF